MEEIQAEFMNMENHMVFQNKPVKLISLKIQINSLALIFKNVKIAPHQVEPNLEIKEIAGLSKNTQYGK